MGNFPFMRSGSRKKRRIQQFVASVETCLPSCCLATKGGCTDLNVCLFWYSTDCILLLFHVHSLLFLHNLLNALVQIANKMGLIIIITPWPKSASELHRPSDRSLLAKLVLTFADRRCHVVRVTDSYGRILGFLDRNKIGLQKQMLRERVNRTVA
jgi:hypothetical protein